MKLFEIIFATNQMNEDFIERISGKHYIFYFPQNNIICDIVPDDTKVKYRLYLNGNEDNGTITILDPHNVKWSADITINEDKTGIPYILGDDLAITHILLDVFSLLYYEPLRETEEF